MYEIHKTHVLIPGYNTFVLKLVQYQSIRTYKIPLSKQEKQSCFVESYHMAMIFFVFWFVCF